MVGWLGSGWIGGRPDGVCSWTGLDFCPIRNVVYNMSMDKVHCCEARLFLPPSADIYLAPAVCQALGWVLEQPGPCFKEGKTGKNTSHSVSPWSKPTNGQGSGAQHMFEKPVNEWKEDTGTERHRAGEEVRRLSRGNLSVVSKSP